jgi:CBS domain containing-hemolysin-like protein
MIVLKPLVLIFVGLIALITAPMKGELIEDDSDGKVEELQTIIETAEDEDVIDEEESELVQAAIEFPDVSASEAMTARVDVLAIDIEDSWDEIIATIAKSHYTRIPVYEGSIDHIIGVLHMNKFLKAIVDSEEVDIRALLMEPCYVYKTMKLPEVLAAFRKHRQHLAVVVDEYGGTLGIISMEDVLEQVVGDIWDETDTVEDEVTKKSESEYEIDGDMPISDFLDLMDIREENFDFESETVGGWTIESFGRFPEAGESFRYADFTVTVLAMNELRVERVLVKIDK